jgi:hypothetical protein
MIRAVLSGLLETPVARWGLDENINIYYGPRYPYGVPRTSNRQLHELKKTSEKAVRCIIDIQTGG